MAGVIQQHHLDSARAARACDEGLSRARVGMSIDRLPADILGWCADVGLLTPDAVAQVIAGCGVSVEMVGSVDARLLGRSGYGDGDGDGYGDGSGFSYDNGSGYGYESCYGSGYGYGAFCGYAYGDGSGYGAGDGYGYGSGFGYGAGDSYGYGYGYGYGDGYGDGHGYGSV